MMAPAIGKLALPVDVFNEFLRPSEAQKKKMKLQTAGIEPATFAVLKRRHNQLDHACFSIKLHLGGNNRSLAAT